MASVVKIRFLLIVLSVSLLTIPFAKAQFNFGTRAGFVYTSVSHEKWLPSYQAGVFSSYDFNEALSISSELSFADRGFVFDPPYLLDNYYIDQHLRYLTLQNSMEWKYSNRFSLLGGFGISALLSVGSTNGSYLYGYYGDDYDFFELWDINLHAGLKYQMTPHFHWVARFSHGLKDIYKADYSYSYYNRGAELSFGYNLHDIGIERMDDVALANERSTKVSFGIRLGIANNTILEPLGNVNEKAIGKKSYEAGIEFRFDKWRYFYLTPGLNYLQRSATYFTGTPEEELLDLKYLSPSFMVGLAPVKTKYFSLAMEAGFYVNFLLSAKEPEYWKDKVPNGYGELDHIESGNVLMSTFYGYEGVVNADKNTKFFFNYRRSRDFTPFAETPASNNVELYNKAETFSLGVRFKLKHGAERAMAHTDSVSKHEFIKKFSSGFKAGFNFNNSAVKDLPDGYEDISRTSLGFHAGYYMQFRMFRNFSLLPELQFIRKGYQYKINGNSSSIKMSYVELSLLMSKAISRHVSLEAGPTVGMRFNGGDIEIDDSSFYNYDGVIEPGISAGLRYFINSKLSISSRYYSSLKGEGSFEANNSPGGGAATSEYFRNIQLSAYWRLSKE